MTAQREAAFRLAVEAFARRALFRTAACIFCDGGAHAAALYATTDVSPSEAGRLLDEANAAFVALAGPSHASCPRFDLRFARIDGPAPSDSSATEIAPLIVGGAPRGILRVTGAAGSAREALYGIAPALSAALEGAAPLSSPAVPVEAVLEALPDGVIVTQGPLRVTLVNRAAREALASLGIRMSEGEELPPGDLADVVAEALAQGRSRPREFEAGSEPRRYMHVTAVSLGESGSCLLLLRDVTEENLMQERLLQSEKMASVGQLVSGVAHELNNPLTGIVGFAQLLLMRDLDERSRQQVETIQAEAERASKIVQNLLSFARRRKARKEPTDLNALVRRVVELRSYEHHLRNIEVALDLAPDLPRTLVDPDQIQQVLLNLIINAEQAVKDRERGRIEVRTRVRNGSIVLTVQDNGPGIAPDALRRIFDPFFTTKQAGEGTGLGLTISYGIVDDHGGRIHAESPPGKGALFTVELPVVAGPAERVEGEAPPEEATPAAGPKRRILVVDDEENIRKLLSGILSMDGHAVDTAKNGVQALERLSGTRYDLLITDIKMPEMDGQALYQRLREVDADLARRTVFITGDTVSPETRVFLQNVQNPCLSKPFRLRDIREAVERALSGAP
ncbi:MAG TPA: ATP-binding protein [Dehalococcoidia bacterium]|jgi:signal transduction histidine kinase/ActR/RegA family two-component response regulator|nr:ATP-binding protein [Dehalococcoidia bacterium]